MPYFIKPNGQRFAVISERNGEVLARFNTREQAGLYKAMLDALHQRVCDMYALAVQDNKALNLEDVCHT